ncbi:MAG: HPr family phosphocarrier protein [Deltaproteobacteria bacterium]|nr:HPr family phosphocarrier protein [Deltaproteobacteria bacterium]
MPTLRLKIINRLGLHARASAVLVQTFQKFKSEVWLSKSGQTVNGRSILGVLTLAASQGEEIEVTAEGEDADDLLTAARTLVANRFGEEA